MKHPETTPGEIARIAHLANNDPYRTEVLILLASLKEISKRNEEQLRIGSQWMIEHDRKDELRFAAIEGKLPSVVSSVGDYNDTKQQVTGAKKLAMGVISALTLLGGFVYFVAWLIKELRS